MKIKTKNNNLKFSFRLDDSISTPHKTVPIKISQIKDKPAKLQAFIQDRKTRKLQQTIEARVPFIPYVPIGRWVEKSEEPIRGQKFTITTPVRKALMENEKILKKPTLKELVSTAKKTASKKTAAVQLKKATTVTSKKKILSEVNSDAAIDLNGTFEILSADENENEENQVNNGMIKKEEEVVASIKSESVELILPKIVEKVVQKKKEPVKKTKSVVSVVPSKKKVEKMSSASVKKPPALMKFTAKIVKPVIRKAIEVPKQAPALSPRQPSPIPIPSPVTSQSKKDFSSIYKFHKSSHDIQTAYLTLQLKEITTDMDIYMPFLPEDTQQNVHQSVQQGNRIINEKLKNFHGILEQFENADKSDVKRVTKEDVENYWELLYEEVEQFKEELIFIREMKAFAMKEADQKKKKRRTTRIPSDATPSRRSRRIADQAETPK